MTSHQLSLQQRIGIRYYRTKLKMLHSISGPLAAKATVDLFTTPYANPKVKETALFKQARRFDLISEGTRLQGYHFTREHADKRLLIVHGFAGSSRRFERYVEPARGKGHEVYMFDAPAHGLSGGKRLNAMMYRQAVLDMMALHGPFDACICHSLGGLAWMLALEERPQERPPKTVLIAPATESTTAADQFFRLLGLPDALRPGFEQLIEELRGKPLQWYAVSRVIPQVNADILWVHDEEDPTTPFRDVVPVMEQRLPHVRFHITKGLGHSRIYKDAAVMKEIIRFL